MRIEVDPEQVEMEVPLNKVSRGAHLLEESDHSEVRPDVTDSAHHIRRRAVAQPRFYQRTPMVVSDESHDFGGNRQVCQNPQTSLCLTGRVERYQTRLLPAASF